MILKLYKNFLNFLWLRPENAVLDTLRAADFRKVLKKYLKKNKKILDISCGDGIFSFICAGGELNVNNDAFSSIKNKKRSSKFDAYDFFDKNYKIKIKKKPLFRFHTGTDWKNNMLKKASKTKLYKNLQLHNNMKKFEINDNNFDLVFSNSAYWVKNLNFHISEMTRVTKVGGHIYLQMKFKDSYLKTIVKNKSKFLLGNKFYEIIDAGRLKTWKGILVKKEFDKVLKGFKNIKIIYYKPLYGDLVALLWDVGFRPLFKPLHEMARGLSKNNYIKIKKQWVDIIYNLSKHYISRYRPLKPFTIEAMEYAILIKKIK
jgi:SAM-dependent methyltransferase